MAKKKQINIALIGQKFMGRTHSNAYLKVAKFFDLPCQPVMHTICGRNEQELRSFAQQWGWQQYCTDWKAVMDDPAIDLIDVGTPNHLHAPMSIEALKNGKMVACEKPLAGTLDDATAMAKAAKAAKVPTFVWYNYRRCPALGLAYQLVQQGKIGKVYHVRAHYLQDWGGPDVPLLWRFQKKFAGSGVHGDLNAHIIDMARFITGEEITEVSALAETFIKERDIIDTDTADGKIVSGGKKKSSKKKGKSTVDDALLFLGRLSGGGLASFEASRLATGRKNANQIEINGDKGALYFNFERMNELMYYDATAPAATQGWTDILATKDMHPYMHAWWPEAHIIGYEHGFINMAADMMKIIGGKKPELPMPDFEDALKTQKVLEAALVSAKDKAWTKVK